MRVLTGLKQRWAERTRQPAHWRASAQIGRSSPIWAQLAICNTEGGGLGAAPPASDGGKGVAIQTPHRERLNTASTQAPRGPPGVAQKHAAEPAVGGRRGTGRIVNRHRQGSRWRACPALPEGCMCARPVVAGGRAAVTRGRRQRIEQQRIEQQRGGDQRAREAWEGGGCLKQRGLVGRGSPGSPWPAWGVRRKRADVRRCGAPSQEHRFHTARQAVRASQASRGCRTSHAP
jgi:hypothetical protein